LGYKEKILENSELTHRLKTKNLIVEKDKDMPNKEHIYFFPYFHEHSNTKLNQFLSILKGANFRVLQGCS